MRRVLWGELWLSLGDAAGGRGARLDVSDCGRGRARPVAEGPRGGKREMPRGPRCPPWSKVTARELRALCGENRLRPSATARQEL
jgi:hypothetical protein